MIKLTVPGGKNISVNPDSIIYVEGEAYQRSNSAVHCLNDISLSVQETREEIDSLIYAFRQSQTR